MVECIAKVSHSSFSIVYNFPSYRLHSSKTQEKRKKTERKKVHDAEKQTKNYRNEWETVFCRFYNTVRALHIYILHCVCVYVCGPEYFDPLFMIISLLMQRFFLILCTSHLVRFFSYDTAFAILAFSFFVLYAVYPVSHPLCALKSVFISYGVYTIADCLCD